MKTQAQYTQGQWKQDNAEPRAVFSYNDGVIICICDTKLRPANESEANARLIAAAPVILEALEMAYEAMSNSEDADGFDPKVFSKIESAIKKSKGE